MNKKHLGVLEKCRFVAKVDVWFVEGSEAKLDSLLYNYDTVDKICDGVGLFYGITNESYIGYEGELPRKDGEVCPLDEFYIYDKNDREISQLTLEEYLKLVR